MSVPPNGSLGCCSDELDAGALEATVALLWVVHQNPDATTDDATTTVGSRFRDCLSTDQQLVLYGLYKRATTTEPTPASSSPSEDGLQPDPPPPSFWNVKAHRKHQAWRDCAGTMSVPEARMAYVRFVAAEAERHRNVHQDIQWLYEACGSLLADRVVYTASSPPTTTNTMNASNGESSSASIGQTETDTTNSANVDIGETCTLAPSEPLDDDGPPKTPQGSICRSRSPSPHSSKAESSKQEVLPKTDDCFPAARNCGRLERRCQAFVSHTLGIEPLIPRGPIDMAWPDWSFAANHCLLATQWSHQQQRRCYERTEQQIVNQWQRALRNSSLPPLDSTTNTTMPKERTTKGDGPNPPEEKEEDDDVVVGLSVRSLLDLYLRVQQYPVGSEVIISPPINVPGMWQVFQHHGLKMVGVDLPSSTKDDDDDDDDERGLLVAVDCNAVVNAITPSTVAIVVVHVFGIIAATEADMLAIRQAAKSYKTKGSLTTEISILEDCSECFSGLEKGCYLGSHHADLSFFSFGLIKTMTCVSGGIVVLRQDDSVTAVKRGSPIAVSMRRLQASSNEPPQTNVEFLWKLVKCLILRAIAQSPLLYGLVVFIIDRIFRIDFDCFVAGVLRGFPPIEKQGQRRRLGAESRKANIELQFQRMIKQIRRRPSTSMLALMHRRLTQSKTTKKAVSERMKYGELLSNRILQMSSNNSGRLCVPIPRIGCRHLHWLCPVVVDDPSIAAKHLRQSGFDATEGASQLCCIEEHSDVCFPRANDLMKNVLYLPQTVGSKDAMDRMLSALKGRKSLRDCRRRKNSFRLQHLSTYANLKLFVAFCAILSALPWTRRVLLTSFALGIFAILSSTVLTLLLLWILRMSMGQFYLKASYGIAKYSELISFGLNGKIGTSRTKGSDDAAHQVPTILGSLKILQLSHNLEMQGKRSVFLTGGSGFVGSLLLRDLLFYRRVLRIEKVFLLLRTKNGTNGKARIVALLNDPMFSFLSDTEKVDIVSVVEGDTTKPNAGVKDDEINHIRHNYNITHIFHCAASVSFTQSLPEAAHANVSSALHLQNLSACLSSSHVQFVHISTAFVHGSLSGNEIEPLPEELHSLGKFDPFEIYRSMCNAQFYASKAMHELGFANTYTFSKCIAEHLLLVNDPTTIIIRPSIIGPAVEVPYEGWAGRVPSTLVAAAALYLSYQWNLWSFSCQSVPCIPVDVVSRYILAKAFMTVTSEERDVDSIETSSDEGYEKVARDSSPSHDIARASYPLYVSQGPRIYAAAWDSTSDAKASFTWFNYAGAVTQVGAVTGHFSRATAYLGLLVATRLLPNAALSVDQFKTLHSVFVKFPFDLVCGLYNWAGRDTSRMMRLLSVLDLPLLFYPFMNTGYYFQSELIAPSDLSGERYLFSCVAAAHTFVAKASSKSNGLTIVLENQPPKKIRSIDLTCLSIAGSDHSGCLINMLWAITQPKGSWCVRVAGFVLAMILHWCFREVTVDIESFAAVKRCNDDSNPPCIVLVPTHRSIFDFLLLSYVSFAIPELQLGIPNIAAAEEFSRLPIMGGILHLLGAFFLRRGRSSVDPDLANMISKIKLKSSEPDSCIEVFIEGTRSRDRRFVQPKTGFLRCLCKGGGRFAMLPISISYERIAEQESLIREASGEQVPRMCLISMFSWAMKAFIGKIKLGRVHISACDPVILCGTIEPDWKSIAVDIQCRQADAVVVSSFHVEATSKLLKLNARVVVSAVAKIGVTFFPESQLEDKLELSSPMNHSEQLSAMLQMGTNLAPLLQRDRPLWSAWMHSSARCRAVDINFDDDDVKLLTNAMILMFDEADLAVQVAVLSLIAKGYQNPDHGHILQIALRHHTGVPTILLNASIHRRIPKTTLTETRENVESSILPILVESEETLGFWGFSDSKFVAKMDSNGMCHVIFESECYALKNKKITSLIPFMEAETRMRFNPLNVAFPDSGKQCTCTPSQVPDDAIEILKAAVSAVSNIDSDRVRHGTGHAQDDVFRVRSRGAMRVPDLVIWPSSEAEVSNVVDLAIKMRLCIIPYGGGTNVSQATRCPSLQIEPRPIVSLDMSKMNKLLGVDEINGLAHVEAGITGRQLENELARLGFTVGHEPDSIEFSTLGGWIATKASGMKRNKYGNIEDIVKSVRIAGRDGVLSHGLGTGVCAWGRESSGFDLLSLALGSEGCLGVITSAIVRIWPVAAVKEYDSLLLRDFGEGTRAMREISKHVTCMPVSVRLLDNAHYRLGMALRPGPSSIISSMVKSFAGEMILWSAGFDQSSVVCVTVAYEGTAEEVRAQKRLITRIVARHGGVRLGPTVGKAAYDMTFMIAYIRDFAMTYHFLSESFESFVPWSQIEAVVTKTKERVCQEHALRCLPGKPFVGCRVTQIYHEGACVYFYFCMSFEGVENASTVYAEIEHAARSEILLHGGSVSHHHGVGKIRSSFLKEINSAPWQATMQSIKKGIDPDNIFGARNGPFSSL